MGYLKPITILFDTGRNLYQWLISKFLYLVLFCKTSLVLFYTATISNIVTHTIIQLHVSTNSMMTNTWNLLPVWVSKQRLWQKKKKKHNKTSSSVRLSIQKLCARKKSYFNKSNCKSEQHNRMQHKVSRLVHFNSIENHAHNIIQGMINHLNQIRRNQKINNTIMVG